MNENRIQAGAQRDLGKLSAAGSKRISAPSNPKKQAGATVKSHVPCECPHLAAQVTISRKQLLSPAASQEQGICSAAVGEAQGEKKLQHQHSLPSPPSPARALWLQPPVSAALLCARLWGPPAPHRDAPPWHCCFPALVLPQGCPSASSSTPQPRIVGSMSNKPPQAEIHCQHSGNCRW